MINLVIMVFVGGALGALLREFFMLTVPPLADGFPLDILAANLLAAFLLGVGAGAIAQVAVKLLPLLRDRDGRTLDGLTAGALTGGVAFMFATSLLISA